jgi:hypothetical protein
MATNLAASLKEKELTFDPKELEVVYLSQRAKALDGKMKNSRGPWLPTNSPPPVAAPQGRYVIAAEISAAAGPGSSAAAR